MKLLARSVKYSMLWKNIILEILDELEKIAREGESRELSRKEYLKLLKILEILND